MPPHKRDRSESRAAPDLPSPRPRKRRADCSSPPPSQSRSHSPSHSLPRRHSTPPSLPLTKENLHKLEESLQPHAQLTMASSRTSSPSRYNNESTKRKLIAYGIHVDKGAQLPSALDDHVKKVIRAPRDPNVPLSPNAGKVVDRRPVSALQNERTAMGEIEPYLLFRGVVQNDIGVAQVPDMTSKSEIYLARFFLPPPSTSNVIGTHGKLAQARPDTAIGYVTTEDAEAAMTNHADVADPLDMAPFTCEEEGLLDGFLLAPNLLFPFLTAQWKSQLSMENITHAKYQSARDGAVIVNYLHQFYEYAFKGTPNVIDIVDTAHFSVTCDLEIVQLWIHWRDGVKHHMEQIKQFNMREKVEMEEARGILKNIVNYAVGERLQKIKSALPGFAASVAAKEVPKVPLTDAMSLSADVPVLKPMTPPTTGSDNLVKRRKGNDGSSLNSIPDAD